MRCKNCGTEIQPGEQYCTGCGTPVSHSSDYVYLDQESVQPQKPKRHVPVHWIIVGAVLFIGAVLIGWLAMGQALNHHVQPGDFPLAETLFGNETTIFATVSKDHTENDIPDELAVFSKGKVSRLSLSKLSKDEQAAFALSNLSVKSDQEILSLIKQYGDLCSSQFLLLITTQQDAPSILEIDDGTLTSPRWLAQPQSETIEGVGWNGFLLYEGNTQSASQVLCRKSSAQLKVPKFTDAESFDHFSHVLIDPSAVQLQDAQQELVSACQQPVLLETRKDSTAASEPSDKTDTSSTAEISSSPVPEQPASQSPAPAAPMIPETIEPAVSSTYILPFSSNTLLNASDIQGLSDYELYLARNEIYARHHRRFKKEDLQSWFDQQSWYSGTIPPDSFDASVLSSIEQANISLIKNEEISRGSTYLS